MKPQKRLAIITSHPIQYNAPLFKEMNERSRNFTIKVFYTFNHKEKKIEDRGFGVSIQWDIPVLEGYDFTFVNNISANPGSHHFNGIINPTLVHEIVEWRADAVLVFGWSFSSHLKAIRYFHGKIPVLFRGDSTMIDEMKGFSVKKTIRSLFLKWLYKCVDLGLYVGSENRKYYEAYGLKAKQLVFGPHAIDNERFAADSDERRQKAISWKKSLGVDENAIVILFAGKLIEKKDPEILIKSFLALNHPGSWLIIVGNGKLEKDLKSKYAKGFRIVFIDFQNQLAMPVAYRMGDIFVLPSKGPGETWGLAVNEAMACGRAVIASDKCGCSSDLIINGRNGYVFKNGNVESLKHSLELAIQNFKTLGINSAKMIQKWNYKATIEELDKLFE